MKIQASGIEGLAWDKQDGLLPAIVQHATSGAVLMLAYMNREALRATFERGRAVFYSRSRQELWEKGQTSGHTLRVTAIREDCDNDTLLVSVLPDGPACHLGTASCFGDGATSEAESLVFLAELEAIIDERIAGSPEGSYTASLHGKGVSRMAQKVGEEGLEVALAAVGEGDARLVGESADLVFHLLVLLRSRGLGIQALVAELRDRHASRSAAAS